MVRLAFRLWRDKNIKKEGDGSRFWRGKKGQEIVRSERERERGGWIEIVGWIMDRKIDGGVRGKRKAIMAERDKCRSFNDICA